MKTTMKVIASLGALFGLFLLVSDMPEASMVTFASVKILGLAFLYGAVKVWEHFIPTEEI